MTVAPDMLQQFGGAPVGSDHRFEGWWGATTFFVDYDHGTAGARGDSMDAPTKHIRVAIANASEGDTIYVRPRDFASGTYGEDPQQITPDTAANWTTVGKPNLSIIGTGKGLMPAGKHKCWVGGYAGLTTAVFNLYSPGCVIENFRMQPVSANTSGLIYSENSAVANYNGGNETIINCDFQDANTSGAINFASTWQISITGNRFVNCDNGIVSSSSYSAPQMVQMWNNYFVGITTEVNTDVYTGNIYRFLSYNNYHTCGQPALGGNNKYYHFNAASTGAIMNCYFGVKDTADTNLFTLNGVLQSGNWCSEGQIITS